MVGLSHICLREVVREYLPQDAETIWPSEMLNSRRIPDENLKVVAEALHDEDEHYWVPQILGNEERPIQLSMKKLEDHGAHGVDINMGCPVRRALKHNYGVALMGDADYAAKVVEITVKSTKLPVSVKLRAGLEKDPEKLLVFIKKLENAGASWITLHPRTAAQKRRGRADWSQIKYIKDNLSIPVIGNGDIQTVDDVFSLLEQTGCDMVMAGRVLTARPWLFWQVGERMGLPAPEGKEGKAPQTPEQEAREYEHCCRLMLAKMQERFSPNMGLRKFLFYVKTSGVWLDFGHHLYSKISGCRSFEAAESALDEFFTFELKMYPRTDLRE